MTMTLLVVGAMASMADLVAIAVTLALVASALGWLPSSAYTAAREAWSRASEPLRQRHRYLPAVGFLGGYVVLWFASAALSATWAIGTLTFVVPAYGGYNALRRGVGSLSLWWTNQRLADLTDKEGVWGLPMTSIEQSKADDVSGHDPAVPLDSSRSTLVCGASGSGKTNTIKWLVDQMDARAFEPTVIFEAKSDYQEHIRASGQEPIIISADESRATHTWNLFGEIGEETPERDIEELAARLFPEPEGKSRYFDENARQLFSSVIEMFYFDSRNGGPRPTNRNLAAYLRTTTQEELADELDAYGFSADAAAIEPGSDSADSIYTTLTSSARAVLKQGFASEADSEAEEFSMREYYANPEKYDGRPVILDYPIRAGSTARAYATLIDDAVLYGLDDADRRAFYLLDEIDHLGAPIENLDRLLNLGRGQGAVAITTIQSVAQLRESYGRDKADALLAGAHQLIAMRSADRATTSAYKARVGTHREVKTGHTEGRQHPLGPEFGRVITEREERVEDVAEFADGFYTSMEAGECLVIRGAGQQYVHGRVALHPLD